MRHLRSRIAKLEGARATTYYISAHMPDEPLHGFELNGVQYMRRAGESDYQRAPIYAGRWPEYDTRLRGIRPGRS